MRARFAAAQYPHRGFRLLALIAVMVWSATSAQAMPDGSLDSEEESSFRQAALSAAPSLVRIQTVGGVDRVGGRLAASSATTGVIVAEDGWIISSAFNFVSKPTSILVQAGKGRYSARLVATDRMRMLTLLKIDATGLAPLRPSANQKVRVGQWAIALGRTFDSPEPSVSVGIISAVNRVWGKAIQTDARVSPVNYGGPLIDLGGNVLGVVVPLSPSGKEETAGVEWYDSGIGFAIPFADVLDSVTRLKAGKDLYPGLLGVTIKEAGVDDKPSIDVVRFDSPAERAGLKSGDVFAEIDGHSIRRHDELKQALGHRYAGDKVSLTVRRGKETVRTEVVLIDKLVPYEPPLLGILPVRVAGTTQRGVTVRYVFPNSAAAKSKIVPGDRIVKWNGTEITTADQLTSLVRRARPAAKVSVTILDGKAEKTVPVTLGADVEEIPHDLKPAPAVAVDKPQTSPAVATKEQAPKGKGAKEPVKDAPKDDASAKKADKEPKLGHFRDTLSGETTANFWAYVPDSYRRQDSWGLVVWIGPGRDSMEAAVLEKWQSACAERRLMIVAPLPGDGPNFGPNDLVGAWRVVEHMLKDYRIDPNRIVMHGYQRGGPFAAVLAFENHERIRGLALASSSLPTAPPEAHPNFPFRFFFSLGDSSRGGDQFDRILKALHIMKFSVTVQRSTDKQRQYLDIAEVAELARWIDSLDRI